MLLEIAHRDRHADGLGRERATCGPQHMRAERHRARGKRDIGRDHNIVGPGILDDPIVRGIRALGDDDVADHRIA